jgi:B-cell receptor-associated protein 31
MEVQARKFYSQRNMYLCGFTLFLSLILNRTYTMILDVLRLESKVKRYEGDSKATGAQEDKLDNAGESGQIGHLKNEIAKRDKNIETLKKQCEGLQREYGVLGDQVAGKNQDLKKDK